MTYWALQRYLAGLIWMELKMLKAWLKCLVAMIHLADLIHWALQRYWALMIYWAL